MKPIRLSKDFEKHYKQRIAPIKNLKAVYRTRVAAFQGGERGYPINDHSLKGKLKGKRAFSIAGDIRVIYEETDEAIIFCRISPGVSPWAVGLLSSSPEAVQLNSWSIEGYLIRFITASTI